MEKFMKELQNKWRILQEKVSNWVKDPQKGSKNRKMMLVGVGSFLIIALLIFTFGFQNKEFKQAMAVGDSYFERGEYGEAEMAYQAAREEKPDSPKAIEMYEASQELGTIWMDINDDIGDIDVHDAIDGKLSSIKNKEVKKAYEDAMAAIEELPMYQSIVEELERYESDYGG